MTRTYDMRKRNRASEATRARVIAAAHRLLNRPDGGSLTLGEVAAEAHVTRATIYNRVGARRDLLKAVFEDQGARIEFDRVLDAMETSDPGEAVANTIRESCRAWSIMPAAIRRTLALATVDPEIRHLTRSYEAARRQRVAGLVDRLFTSAVLPGWTDRDYAVSTLAFLTGFPAYDQLAVHLDPATVENHLMRMAIRAVGIPQVPVAPGVDERAS